MESIKIVLGLGNPGLRYRGTRHNVGFRVVDCLAARGGVKLVAEGETRSCAWSVELGKASGSVVLAKPRTFMNRSGRAARSLCTRYGFEPGEMLVVYDDADLELGRLRIRHEGGAGGHNGIRSLIEVLGTGAFPRVRLGIRGALRDTEELSEYVLRPFDPSEESVVDELVERAADAVDAALDDGLEFAMNRYNVRGSADRTAGDTGES